MINKQQILKELEEILNTSVDLTTFPYVKGNSIRIGKYIVRSNKYGHKVFDCKENIMVAETFSKSAAIALAKTLAKGVNAEREILDIDKNIMKWYNDCMFFNNSFKNSKDDVKKEVVSVRYDIAKAHAHSARDKLDKYIYR